MNKIGYFNFDEHWGNNRGFTWEFTMRMFGEYGFMEKLLDAGRMHMLVRPMRMTRPVYKALGGTLYWPVRTMSG